jgi:putative drug exporter of the RND superfamily
MMIASITRVVLHRPRTTIAAFLVLLIVAGVAGTAVFGRLQSQGYTVPGSDSDLAAQRIMNDFGAEEPFAVLIIDTQAGVDDPSTADLATTIVAEVAAEDEVTSVASYWTSGTPESLRSNDGSAGLVLVYSSTVDESDIDALGERFTSLYNREVVSADGVKMTVHAGGWAAISHAINENIKRDITRAELIAVPVTLVLLLFVFGSIVAAGLPLLLGGSAIVGSFLALLAVTYFTDVSIYALNLITGLGLGLGIDYSLLIINRFREELKRGLTTEQAVMRTMHTAGRTVTISGITVAVTLSALIVFPQYFLKSFAYAGVIVVSLTVLASLTVLPAVLGLLGPRLNKGQILRGDLAPKDTGAWANIAHFVMRRPVPVLLITVAALGALALPATTANFNQVDDRVLPPRDPAAIATEMIRDRFSSIESAPIDIVVPSNDDNLVEEYARALSSEEGIVRVQTRTTIYIGGLAAAPNPAAERYAVPDAQRMIAVANVSPRSPAAESLIEQLREVPAPAGTLIGGTAAEYTDAQNALASRLTWVIAWIAIATLIVLFLFTGSVLLPFKAIALNLLGLSATLGVLVLIFQEGHLSWLVGEFTLTGALDTSTLVLIAVVAFGLSMDYEIFLLSRIKEEHDAGRDNREAVALGLQRSGRIISAAALLLAIVFASFISSGVTSIKMLGFGVAFAILVDATIVRGLLVPAFMRIAGRWNWWAPAPLRSLHRRFGLSD